MLQWAGVTLTGDAIVRSGRRDPGATPAARSGLGFFVQGSYLLPWFDVELGARFGRTWRIGAPEESAFEPEGEFGGGLSWYIDERHLMLRADYFRLWREGGIGGGDDRVRVLVQATL